MGRRQRDEFLPERKIILEINLDQDNKIRFWDVRYRDVDSGRTFWHAIKILRIAKNQKGKWYYTREKLNIKYSKFPIFQQIIATVNNQISKR
jgi:hypothetical protein